ncbi:hypothetical protein AJ79_09694 [Helicocarpus griseus UAMH5409]|uniref:Uncharacterized protein n=1 Tax=Helicocarpus griseus UAMH5409 TaxID=1447875 RepID=A0A2B7W9E3_9EURO|nr:hypothetical protein AJ79_09694 [Helicocarpus griseus UAMH5409]
MYLSQRRTLTPLRQMWPSRSLSKACSGPPLETWEKQILREKVFGENANFTRPHRGKNLTAVQTPAPTPETPRREEARLIPRWELKGCQMKKDIILFYKSPRRKSKLEKQAGQKSVRPAGRSPQSYGKKPSKLAPLKGFQQTGHRPKPIEGHRPLEVSTVSAESTRPSGSLRKSGLEEKYTIWKGAACKRTKGVQGIWREVEFFVMLEEDSPGATSNEILLGLPWLWNVRGMVDVYGSQLIIGNTNRGESRVHVKGPELVYDPSY